MVTLFFVNESLRDRIPTTRLSLMARLIDEADESSWDEFVKIYRPAIYRIARRRGLQPAGADDVAQHVMLAASQKIREWEIGKGSLRAWLLTVTRNILVNELTRRQSDRGMGGEQQPWESVVSQEEDPSVDIDWEYRRAVFRKVAEQLKREVSTTTWACFWESAVGGLDAHSIAEKLGIQVGSVYAQKCRVLKRLRQLVEETEGEPQ